ncbi:MAG: hypothetical protein OEN55_14580 [Alphaproteobacteria bacterium]|nr:hypothetical protein [Alphaproteobacteria bacterium]
MAPRSKRTAAREKRFLAALGRGVSVAGAAAEAGICRAFAYRWRAADAGFAARWDAAYEEGTDTLEDEARRRAVQGTETPVYYAGRKIGVIRRCSDALLMFLLRGRRREKYRERLISDYANTGIGPIGIDYAGLSELEFNQRLVVLANRLAEGGAGARIAGGDRPVGALDRPREPGDADAAGPGPGEPGG